MGFCKCGLSMILVSMMCFTHSGSLKMRNKGDRHNVFIFHIPSRYINSTLGPESYTWIVETFGQLTADNAGIYRAPSDSHICGNHGWCRSSCLESEKGDWTLKDHCGRYFCCENRE